MLSFLLCFFREELSNMRCVTGSVAYEYSKISQRRKISTFEWNKKKKFIKKHILKLMNFSIQVVKVTKYLLITFLKFMFLEKLAKHFEDWDWKTKTIEISWRVSKKSEDFQTLCYSTIPFRIFSDAEKFQ